MVSLIYEYEKTTLGSISFEMFSGGRLGEGKTFMYEA